VAPRRQSLLSPIERALLARVVKAAEKISGTSLVDLIKRHRTLERLMIDLANAVDAHQKPKQPVAAQRFLAKLRCAEDRVGKRISELEELVVLARARTLHAAIWRLRFYAGLQGYDLADASRGRRDSRPIEERLFRSIIADVERITQQSSDHRRAINVRK
jgi:hypothetical protein